MNKLGKLLFASAFGSLLLTSCNLTDTSSESSSHSSSTSQSSSPSSSTSPTSGSSKPPKPTTYVKVADTINAKILFLSGVDEAPEVPVYYLEGYDDIPYAKFEELYAAFLINIFEASPSFAIYKSKVIQDGVYKIYNVDREDNEAFNVDINEDKMAFVVDTLDAFELTNRNYNGVEIFTSGGEQAYCRVNNTKSVTRQERKLLSYDFGKYGIDIVADTDGNVYFPLHTLFDIVGTANTYGLVFNGANIYSTYTLDNYRSHYRSTSTFLNNPTRTSALAEFTYKQLCFTVDNFYGLAKERNIGSFDSKAIEYGYKDDLLSTDVATYEMALSSLIGKWFSDGHSAYTEPSLMVYNDRYSYINNYWDIVNTQNERVKKMHDDLNDMYYQRSIADKDVGLDIYDDTAVIRFDEFVKAGDTTSVYPYLSSYSYSELHNFSSELMFKKCFDELEGSDVKNVVVDVTVNGGGLLNAVIFLEAFFTNDPSMTIYNSLTNEVSEVHYNVDTNHNGFYEATADNYVGKYNFYLLTSNYSFSCANYFPTVIKEKGAMTIIGETSGGGECVVGQFSTASGSIIRNSSVFHMGYYDQTESKFVGNDNGTEPDYEYPRSKFYDMAYLDNFLASH